MRSAAGMALAFGLLLGCAGSRAPVSRVSSCDGVASLAAAGKHRAAVDQFEALQAQEVSCPDPVAATVAESRERLGEADALLRQALEAMGDGDLAAAERSLAAALGIDPAHPEIESARGDLLAARCARLEGLVAAGEYKPAVDEIAVLRAAGSDCPEPARAAAEQARTRLEEADALVLTARQSRDAGALAAAEENLRRALEIYPKYHWARKLLADLGSDSDSEQSPEARRAAAEKSLALSRQAERAGNLSAAQRSLAEAIAARPLDPALRAELVESARLLGLKLFSAGELTRARELWTAALSLDQANDKLRDYLQEVEERLESLARIKTGEPDP